MQCIVVKYLHIKHTEKNALCYFKHSQILRFGKKLITAHCCFDVSKLMTRTCGVLQEVLKLLKPYLVYDPKPKVMYMGHIRPTGKPFTWLPQDPSTANQTSIAQLQLTACCFQCYQEACEWAGQPGWEQEGGTGLYWVHCSTVPV